MSEPYLDDPDFEDGEEASPGLPAFLLDPRGVLDRRWRWMVAALVTGLIATGAVAFVVPPRFAASASVLISSQEIPQDFIRSTVRESSLSNLNATVSQVLSNSNLERIIDHLDLFVDERDKTPIEKLATRLRADIEIKPEKMQVGEGTRGQASIVYNLAYVSESPQAAASVTNALAALVVEASISQRNERAQRITRFLRGALNEDERELREQSRQVSEFRRANRGQLPEELETSMRKLELLDGRRASLQSQIAESEGRILALRSRRTTAERSKNELLLDELRSQLARESAVNTEDHPAVKSLRRRVANLEVVVQSEGGNSGGRITSEAQVLIDSERREIGRMREQIVEVDASVKDVAARIDRTPAIGEELDALERKEEVLRDSYIDSLRKVEQAELAETLELSQQGAQVSILNRATPPTSPILPRWMLVVAGLAASIGLALALAVLMELLDPVVVDLAQLATISERPVLGAMPWVQ